MNEINDQGVLVADYSAADGCRRARPARSFGHMKLMSKPSRTSAVASSFHACSGSPSQMADAANPNTGTSKAIGAIDSDGVAPEEPSPRGKPEQCVAQSLPQHRAQGCGVGVCEAFPNGRPAFQYEGPGEKRWNGEHARPNDIT